VTFFLLIRFRLVCIGFSNENLTYFKGEMGNSFISKMNLTSIQGALKTV